MSENNTTSVKLFCPSSSTAVELVAHDEQKIDIGYIARTFGLEPATVKLNGYFISRGADFIACSLTWKSLIKFFKSRGLSSGTCGSGGIVVDGKLFKSGSKRAHDSVNGIPSMGPLPDESNSSKKTKVKDQDTDGGRGKRFVNNGLGLKRKQEDVIASMKKLKVNESGLQEGTCSETVFRTRVPCGFLGVNMKRVREDEMVLPSPCKKIR